MRIRPATVLDVPALAALHEVSWVDTYTGLVDPAVIARATTNLEERWGENIAAPANSTWVAIVDEELVGFILLGAVGPGHPSPLTIRALYVHPDHLGQGIGTALLDYATGDMSVYTWALKGNDRGMKFWTSRGFVACAEETSERYGGAPLVQLVRGGDHD